MRGGHEFLAFSSGLRKPPLPAEASEIPHRYLPLPTRLLYKVWTHARWPAMDHLLRGIDVFHATNYFLPPVKRVRTVLSIYDLAFMRHPDWSSPKIAGLFSRNMAAFAGRADRILTCSQATRVDVIELLHADPAKVFVAYGAADPLFAPVPREVAAEFVRSTLGIERPYLLFVSTLEPRKNVAGLLRAFSRIADRIPHNLVLLGREGWNPIPTSRLISDLNIADRVTLLGYVGAQEALPNLYSAADVFVLPSFYEGFGLPVLEAMQCGCPVVTTRVSALPEVGGEAVHYVTPGDDEELAEAMAAIAEDESRREAMSALGLEQARRFSWEACAQATMAAYGSLA